MEEEKGQFEGWVARKRFVCFLCRAGPTRSNTDQLRSAVDRDFVAAQGRRREEKREGDESNRLPRAFPCRSDIGTIGLHVVLESSMTVFLKRVSL